jgi:hypothetical protein
LLPPLQKRGALATLRSAPRHLRAVSRCWAVSQPTAHWDVPDLAKVEGNDEHRSWAFLDVAVQLKRHTELLQSLPWELLDRLPLQRHVTQGPSDSTAP